MVHYLTIIFLMLSSCAYAAYSPMNIKESDGSPDVKDVRRINVSNGSLTDDGNGIITILTGIGASGDITDVFNCSSGDCGSITMGATDFLDMSGTDSSTTTEGLKLPQHATACAGGTAEGQVCWEADADILWIGDGSTLKAIGAGDITAVGNCTSGDCFTSGGTGSTLNSVSSTLTLGRVGGTNNESMALDFETNANKIGISSATGVTDLTWTGNLGLGTTAPQQNIDVRGNGLFLTSDIVTMGLPAVSSSILSVAETDGRVAVGGLVGDDGDFSFSSTTVGVGGADIDIDFASNTTTGVNNLFKTSVKPAVANLSGFLNGSTSLSATTSESSETLAVALSQSSSEDNLITASAGKGSTNLSGVVSGSFSSSVDSVEVTPNITYASDLAVSSGSGYLQFSHLSNVYDNVTLFSVGGVVDSSGSFEYTNSTSSITSTADVAGSSNKNDFSYVANAAQTLQAFHIINDSDRSWSSIHNSGSGDVSFDYAASGSGSFGFFMDNDEILVSEFGPAVAIAGSGPSLDVFIGSDAKNFMEIYAKDADYNISGTNNFGIGLALSGKSTTITGNRNFAIGQGINITASDAFVIGKNVTNNTSDSLAIGFNSSQSTTTTMFVDGTNSRVGIGDSTPSATLSVGSGDLFQVSSSGAVLSVETITSSRTSDLGWSIQTGANTACNTTCTYACVHGWETTSGEVAVSCTDATADKCLCAGAS